MTLGRGRGSGFERAWVDEHNRDCRQSVGGSICLLVVLQDATSETAGGGRTALLLVMPLTSSGAVFDIGRVEA
jgi:hypothetical protein